MVVRTKFAIGDEVYPRLGEGMLGMIVRIIVYSDNYVEYHVKFGPGQMESYIEEELMTEEEYKAYRIIKGSNYGEES